MRTDGDYAKFEIPKEVLESFLDEDFLINEIATILSVSDVSQRAWANHRMRTTKTNPLRLWIAGQAQNPVDLDIPLYNLIQ